LQKIAESCLQNPAGTTLVKEKTNGTGELTNSQRGTWPVKSLGTSTKATCDREGPSCSLWSPHKFCVTYEEPCIALEILGKQIQFLLEIGACYSVLPAYVGKSSLRLPLS
jgi:hypothetical protein